MTPHISCPMASAKLMVAMSRPVDPLSGAMKSPIDCRAPIVTMRMAAAARVTPHALRAPPSLLAGMRGGRERPGAPCFVRLQMGIRRRKQRQLAAVCRHPAAAPKKIAQNMVGFDRSVAFHVTEHRGGQWRARRGQCRAYLLQKRRLRRVPRACSNGAAFFQKRADQFADARG